MPKNSVIISILLFPLVFVASVAISQERRPLSVADVEFLLKEIVSRKRVAELIEERGINFEATGEIRGRLEKAGADTLVMLALVRASQEFVKKKFEQQRRLAEERRKAEEEKRRVEEERKTAEEDARRKEEERQRRVERAIRVERERRKAEEEEMERRAGMVLIEAGEFWMGSNDGRENEKPRRRVYLDGFYIDRYEVTNSQYEKFMKATGHEAPEFWSDWSSNEPEQPVVGVSWHDAEAYCKWAGRRLPTEAEWEKAARGTDGRKYPWGNGEPDGSKANYYFWWIFFTRTAHVGSYPKGVSPYGVHDMAGNVWEWVADWYGESYYQRAPSRNPNGPEFGPYRVLRGGAWLIAFYNDLRSSYRHAENPTYRHHYLGFRCAW